MKVNKKGRLLTFLFAMLLIALLGAVMTVGVFAEDAVEAENTVDVQNNAVSPALHILAARTDMAVATLCGNDYYFSRDVFARSLNVSAASLQYITVVSLPGVTEGELLIGSTRVSAG
ncbi:MAG: hypothetical protein IKW66_05715 [Clostridia bacterium]|nr:hypothetical protein [Clostridia bacterium]